MPPCHYLCQPYKSSQNALAKLHAPRLRKKIGNKFHGNSPFASCSDTNPLTAQTDLELREICIPCPAPPVVMTSCSGQALLWCSQIVVPCPILLKPADVVARHPSVEISGRIWASLCLGMDMRYGACSVGAVWKRNSATFEEVGRWQGCQRPSRLEASYTQAEDVRGKAAWKQATVQTGRCCEYWRKRAPTMSETDTAGGHFDEEMWVDGARGGPGEWLHRGP